MSDTASYFNVPETDRVKAKAFFDRAAPLVAAGQYDYAFTMYLNGLLLDPEAIDAHQALRDASLRRKAGGGKSLGMFGSMKFPSGGKDEKVNMNNAERILAHDPGDTGAMLSLMEAAYRCGCYDTVLWIGPILGQANNQSAKPDFKKFEKLRDHYAKLGRWSDAVSVCTRMLQMRPDDMDLKNDLKNLSATEAMNKGKYGGSFRDSIKNMQAQADLLASERDQMGEEYTDKVAREAATDLALNPTDLSKVSKYVDALRKTGKPANIERAYALLTETFEKTGAYKFRVLMIEMRIKDLQNQDRIHRADIAKTPADAEKLAAYKEFTHTRAAEELALYRELATQYPTEATYKYEVANRLVGLDQYLEAIPLYQTSVSDPKLRTKATLALGRTFLAADFPDEAADTLQGLIGTYPAMSAGDETARAIMYWHGRAIEAKGDAINSKELWTNALKSYSTVVQWDFNYRDTQKRIKDVRAKIAK